jgi:hypothetical protein
MNEFEINNSNFSLHAAHAYKASIFKEKEFIEDLKRFKYIKRLFNRFVKTGKLKERLILNHLVILYNVFDIEQLNRMLFFKLEGYYHILKPFLIALNYCPDFVTFNQTTIDINTIIMADSVVVKLRELLTT